MIECSICKANNEDRSLFCFECGQRLIPKVPNAQAAASILPTANMQQINVTNSGRLHSPILDLGGQTTNKRNKSLGKLPEFDDDNPRQGNGGRANSISRNGLYSPLLDGQNHQNHFVNPYPDQTEDIREITNAQPHTSAPVPAPSDKSRLHSPVLDGPLAASASASYSAETYSESNEYESLRSPLLQAKIPLPDKIETLENSTGQENRLQSLLGPSTAPAAKTVSNDLSGYEQQGFIAPLSITGINKLSQADNHTSTPSPTPQPNLLKPNLGRTAVASSNYLLPREEEVLPTSKIQNNSPVLNKTLLIPLIFAAFCFKVWYLLSLGSAVFGSAPFAFDQGGQIIVLLLMLVLVLS